MNATMKEHWDSVEEALELAKAITWDECHKIYLAMDDEQVAQFHDYGYEEILPVSDENRAEMLATLVEWYDFSCSLRFICSVETLKTHPNARFYNLIPQFAEGEEDEEDYESENE
jgi:hypothetical protein